MPSAAFGLILAQKDRAATGAAARSFRVVRPANDAAPLPAALVCYLLATTMYRADLNRSDTNSRNRSDTNSTLRLCWAGSVCRPGRIGSPAALPPLASGLPSTRPVRSLGARVKNENVLARASAGDIPSVDRCCDSPSPRRRRRYRRGTHRWPCRRNDYRSRSHRATLLSAATGLCGSRALLLLDAWRTGMGWISGRLDLPFG
jgi:hypothetical protein